LTQHRLIRESAQTGGQMDAAADDLTAVALLAEPVRQRLYSCLRERGEPVGRVEAARHCEITARLAAFHLDRMARAGLLEVQYRRLSGRVGPGAGRPAKLYSISPHAFSVAIPQTRYALAASMMATALSGTNGAGALQDAATALGEDLGSPIRQQARSNGARQEAVERQLRQLGYEPLVQDGEWTLRNCIFAEVAAAHRELVCGMNAALIAGLVSGAQLNSVRVRRRMAPPACCVGLTSA
jgi:predicted ArsR family transcriptional regulator